MTAPIRSAPPLKIWVDADACPASIRDILYKATERTGIKLTLVANQFIATPPSRMIDMLQVSKGFDVADKEILNKLSAGDLVITGDIPLAADVIEKGGYALNPRGEFYNAETIRSRLNMRDFMESLRSSGIHTGGPTAFSQTERRAFANCLDSFLSKHAPIRSTEPK